MVGALMRITCGLAHLKLWVVKERVKARPATAAAAIVCCEGRFVCEFEESRVLVVQLQ